MTAVLEVTGLVAGYDGRAVVHDLDLSLRAGSITCLFGPNGAGKTTTLLALSGLVPRLSGGAVLDGTSMHRWGPGRRSRAGLGHVPEDRSLFSTLTVGEHLRLSATKGGPDDADVYGWFPQLVRLLDRRAGLLSGGEQQMLAVARALMRGPRVLMIDEMSLGLAPIVVTSLLATLRQIVDESGCAVLLVEQHVSMALDVADDGIVLSRGRVTLRGSADELRTQPDLLRSSYLG